MEKRWKKANKLTKKYGHNINFCVIILKVRLCISATFFSFFKLNYF